MRKYIIKLKRSGESKRLNSSKKKKKEKRKKGKGKEKEREKDEDSKRSLPSAGRRAVP
jgi:hypothetical protein